MKVPLPLTNGSYLHPSQPTNNQRCVNLFSTDPGPVGWTYNYQTPQGTLIPTMGSKSLKDLATTFDSVSRGHKYIKGYLYAVIGTGVYKIAVDQINLTLTETLIGTMNTNSNKPVKITNNPTQVIFVDGSPNGYIYDIDAGTFAEIADADFLGGTHVVYIDGYFIYNLPQSNKVYFSELDDGTDWEALSVASAQSRPDLVVGLAQTKGELWIFGEQSVEVWFDEGNPPPGAPFSKRVGSDIDIGCSAPYSITEVSGNIVWLDSRGFVAQSDNSNFFRNQSSGYTLIKLSTPALDDEIASYHVTRDAIGSTYVYRGHVMYELTFPYEQKTWVYDTTTKQWHERTYHNTVTNEDLCSITQYYEQVNNLLIGGGTKSGKLYVCSRNYLSDDSNLVRRLITIPFVHENFKEISISELELKCKTGTTNPSILTNSQAIDNVVMATTISSFTSGTISNNVITTITDYDGTFNATRSSNVAWGVGSTGFNISVSGNVVAQLTTQKNIAVQCNNGEWFFGWILGASSPTGAFTIISVNVVLQQRSLLTADPTNGYYVGVGNNIVSNMTAMTLRLQDTVEAYSATDPVVLNVYSTTTPTYSTTVSSVNESTKEITVALTASYLAITNIYTLPGYTLTVDGDSAVTSITLDGAPPTLNVGMTIRVYLNDSSIFSSTLLSVNGSVVTFSGFIASTDVANGNIVIISQEDSVLTDPYIQMRFSHDGGYTWSEPQIRSLGKLGELNKRITWNSLGGAREWIFEFLVVDVVDYSIIDATIDYTIEEG